MQDIEQLFRNINQVDIPYRVFEPPVVPSPAIGRAEHVADHIKIAPAPTTWAPEEAPTTKGKVFGKYLDEAESLSVANPVAGTLLKPIFDRLREKCQAANGAVASSAAR